MIMGYWIDGLTGRKITSKGEMHIMIRKFKTAGHQINRWNDNSVTVWTFDGRPRTYNYVK